MKERVTFPHEFWEEGKFFFVEPSTYDAKVVETKWNQEVVSVIADFKTELQVLNDFSAEEIKAALNRSLEKLGIKIGKVLQAIRVAITGVGAGPDLMNIIEILGKEEVLKRLDKAVATLNSQVKV